MVVREKLNLVYVDLVELAMTIGVAASEGRDRGTDDAAGKLHRTLAGMNPSFLCTCLVTSNRRFRSYDIITTVDSARITSINSRIVSQYTLRSTTFIKSTILQLSIPRDSRRGHPVAYEIFF